jgi:hypothetical protein
MDFSQYLTDSARTGNIWWAYKFPNGHAASVIPDLHMPLHFEVESTDPQDVAANPVTTTTGAGTVSGLTTADVEGKLTRLAGLERNEDAE